MTDDQLIAGIIDREGGFVNHPADRGGPTQFGITKARYERTVGHSVTLDEFKARCTLDVARGIYRDDYLKPWLWVTKDRLRALLVDWAVTSGHDDPAKAIQAAVGADVDGVLGPQTIRLTLAALEAGLGAEVHRLVLTARAEHYMRLALDEPQLKAIMAGGPKLQLVFLKGWLRRVLQFA